LQYALRLELERQVPALRYTPGADGCRSFRCVPTGHVAQPRNPAPAILLYRTQNSANFILCLNFPAGPDRSHRPSKSHVVACIAAPISAKHL